MFYDLNWNMNSSSNELKSHMEDFIYIIITILKGDKDFGSGKNHVLDICTKSYVNRIGAVIKSPPFNF